MSTRPKRLQIALYCVEALILVLGFLLIGEWSSNPSSGPDFEFVIGSVCVAAGIGLIVRSPFGYSMGICAVLGIVTVLSFIVIPEIVEQFLTSTGSSFVELSWFVGLLIAVMTYIAWREPSWWRRLTGVRLLRMAFVILVWVGGIELLTTALPGPHLVGTYDLFRLPVVAQFVHVYYSRLANVWESAVTAAVVAGLAWSAVFMFSVPVRSMFQASGDFGVVASRTASDYFSRFSSKSASRFAIILTPLFVASAIHIAARAIEQFPCADCGNWTYYLLQVIPSAILLAAGAAFIWLNKAEMVRLVTTGSWNDLLLVSAAWSIGTALTNLEIADLSASMIKGNLPVAIAGLAVQTALLVGVASLIVFRKAPFWTALPLFIGIPDLIFVTHALSSGWYGVFRGRISLCLFDLASIHASRAAVVGTTMQLLLAVNATLKARSSLILTSVAFVLAVLAVTSLLIVGDGMANDWTDSSCSPSTKGLSSWMNYIWP